MPDYPHMQKSLDTITHISADLRTTTGERGGPQDRDLRGFPELNCVAFRVMPQGEPAVRVGLIVDFDAEGMNGGGQTPSRTAGASTTADGPTLRVTAGRNSSDWMVWYFRASLNFGVTSLPMPAAVTCTACAIRITPFRCAIALPDAGEVMVASKNPPRLGTIGPTSFFGFDAKNHPLVSAPKVVASTYRRAASSSRLRDSQGACEPRTLQTGGQWLEIPTPRIGPPGIAS